MARLLVAGLLAVGLPGCAWQGEGGADQVGMKEFPVALIAERSRPCPAPCERDALVFVHGIFGSRETWLNDQGRTWQQLIVDDPNLESFDVYRVDYETTFLSLGRRPRVTEISDGLYSIMRDDPRTQSYRAIYMIGHSLGGNLIRHYLLNVKAEAGHRALNRFHAIVLLGAPSDGAQIARLAQLVSNDPKLKALEPADSNDYLEALNSLYRKMDCKRWQGEGPHIAIYAGYETQPVRPVGVVVPKVSAVYFADGVQGFARNHMTLVKPRDRNDEVYRWVKEIALNHAPVSVERPTYCPPPR